MTNLQSGVLILGDLPLLKDTYYSIELYAVHFVPEQNATLNFYLEEDVYWDAKTGAWEWVHFRQEEFHLIRTPKEKGDEEGFMLQELRCQWRDDKGTILHQILNHCSFLMARHKHKHETGQSTPTLSIPITQFPHFPHFPTQPTLEIPHLPSHHTSSHFAVDLTQHLSYRIPNLNTLFNNCLQVCQRTSNIADFLD